MDPGCGVEEGEFLLLVDGLALIDLEEGAPVFVVPQGGVQLEWRLKYSCLPVQSKSVFKASFSPACPAWSPFAVQDGHGMVPMVRSTLVRSVARPMPSMTLNDPLPTKPVVQERPSGSAFPCWCFRLRGGIGRPPWLMVAVAPATVLLVIVMFHTLLKTVPQMLAALPPPHPLSPVGRGCRGSGSSQGHQGGRASE